MAENMVNWESRAHHMESISWDKALIVHRRGTNYLDGHFECGWLYKYGNLPWLNSHEVNEDWNIGRGKKMRLELRRCLCFFFVAFLGVGFRSGALSRVASSQCNGSIAQCFNQDEFLMESEISRRFLADPETKYIYPGALKPDLPPLSNPNPALPYTRKCVYEPSKPC